MQSTKSYILFLKQNTITSNNIVRLLKSPAIVLVSDEKLIDIRMIALKQIFQFFREKRDLKLN